MKRLPDSLSNADIVCARWRDALGRAYVTPRYGRKLRTRTPAVGVMAALRAAAYAFEKTGQHAAMPDPRPATYYPATGTRIGTPHRTDPRVTWHEAVELVADLEINDDFRANFAGIVATLAQGERKEATVKAHLRDCAIVFQESAKSKGQC